MSYNKNKTVEELIIRTKIEGLGYALQDYYGEIECIEDPKMEELWNNAVKALKDLEKYFEDNYPELNEYEY